MILKSIFGRGRQELDQTEVILGRYLDADFTAFPYAPASCAPADISSMEKLLGVKLPLQFAAHLCGRLPGLRIEAKEAVWPRPKPLDVVPFWTLLYGFETYTAFPTSEPWMRLDVAAEKFWSATGIKAVPILRIIGDRDLYCAMPDGRIGRFHHDDHSLEPLDEGFWEIFEVKVRSLRERKDEKVAGARNLSGADA